MNFQMARFWKTAITLLTLFTYTQASLFRRNVNPTCNRDNCLRSIIASNINGGVARGSSDCTSYFRTTVTPCPSTNTVTITSTVTGSISTVTQNSVTGTTSVITVVTTQQTTVSGTTEVDVVTSTISSTTSVAIATETIVTTIIPGNVIIPVKRNVGDLAKRATISTPPCSATTSTPTSIPAYASFCSGSVRYSSACLCNGATRTVVTLPASTSTVTTTVFTTSTPVVTVTATSTSVTTSTVASTTVSTVSVPTTTMTTTFTTAISTVSFTTVTTTTTTAVAAPFAPGMPYYIRILDSSNAFYAYVGSALFNLGTPESDKSTAIQFLLSPADSNGLSSLRALNGPFQGQVLGVQATAGFGPSAKPNSGSSGNPFYSGTDNTGTSQGQSGNYFDVDTSNGLFSLVFIKNEIRFVFENSVSQTGVGPILGVLKPGSTPDAVTTSPYFFVLEPVA